ncbi:MAG TPA: DUF2334 domain-containing protein [Steroidobacteraceae bacterium]|jgi:hypothetical protein
MMPERAPARWLPPGKRAAVSLSVDDIHPATSVDSYEAGGDLAAGALGRLAELQRRHCNLKATLCVTPDWRLDSLVPDVGLVRRIPWLNRRVHWTRLRPVGHFRLDRYPSLVGYLNEATQCEVVLHGLTHSHVGREFAVEFQDETEAQCTAIVQRGLAIFQAADLRFVRGFVPPAWNAPPALIAALDALSFEFLCSARDIDTPVSAEATASKSGLRGVSLIYPQFVGRQKLVHFTSNFQATSSFERAYQILDHGGLLHVKAHIFKSGGGRVMLDGLDEHYLNYLDSLFCLITERYGAGLWWATLSEVAQRVRTAQ